MGTKVSTPTGLYIGTFDPFTSGHLDIVNQALSNRIYPPHKESISPVDRLIICIGQNKSKTPTFTAEERKKFIEFAIADHPRAKDITVIVSNELTVDIARDNNVTTLIRGIRSDADLQSERVLAETNRFLAAQRGYVLDTVFILQKDAFLKTVSSSLVRTLLQMEEYTAAARCLPLGIAQQIIADKLKPLFCESFTDQTQAEELWNRLVETYLPRPYHNLLHLAHMFEMLKLYLRYNREAERFLTPELNLAIFLHDYVYETDKEQNSSYQNEKASADLASEWIHRYAHRHIHAFTVFEMIMATTHNDAHLPDDHWHRYHLIADLDLCILGTADPAAYEAYVSAVRKEYGVYSDEEYKKGRLAFLLAFLKKENLFHTAFFRKMFEAQARRNIEAEVKRLQQA